MKHNLDLWVRVATTDPRFTKSAGYGRKYTSISPAYQAKNLTLEFGMSGAGWGLRNLEYNIEEVEAAVAHEEDLNKPKDQQRKQYRKVKILWLICDFWYVVDGEVFTIPTSADMVLSPNQDCYKKLRTQCRSKAMADLGFNADVFLGQYDNVKYKEETGTSFLLSECKTESELNALYKNLSSDLKKEMVGDFSKRKAQILGTEPTTTT
jgi:hypothetical protein